MVIEQLTKKYDGKNVVNNVSFQIHKGSVTSLIGPNGAGKSTVMSMISRLIEKDSGIIDFKGKQLDIYHATNMMKMVRKLCDELGKTVIMVLHEINYASFYSDYICAFKDGKIAKYGTVKEVITKDVLAEIYNVDFEILEIEGKPLSIYY